MRMRMRREFERVICPGCGRVIAAYIPQFGDGSGLRTVKHVDKSFAPRVWDCPASRRIIVRQHGAWRIEQ